MMKQNDQVLLLKEKPVGMALMSLMIPSILTSLVNTLHNLIDTIYISQLMDNAMIAATTVALPISTIIQACGDAIGVGAGGYLGRLLGAKNDDKVQVTISTAISMALILSGIAFVGAFTVLRPMITLFTDEPRVIEYTYQYMQILIMLSIFTIFKQILSYLLRSGGDVRFPMFSIISSVALNILLNPFLMFDWGLGLGLKGAAWATIIAEAVAAILMMARLYSRSSFVQWKPCFLLELESMKEIWRVGIAVFIRTALPSFSYGLFARSAGLFGTDYVAAAGVARKAERISTFVIMGMAHGYQPFASYNYGAKNKRRLLTAIKYSMLLSIGYGALASGLFMMFPHEIMRLVTKDTTLILLSENILRGYALCFPALAVYQILAGTFQSTGQGKLSLFSSILRQGVIYCPLMYVLPRLFQESGFALVQPICDWLSMLCVCLLSRQLIKEIKAMPENGLMK